MLSFSAGNGLDLSGSPRPRSPKRRRIPLACEACRERQVRCDGGRPVCGVCQRRGVRCEYLVIADTAKYQTERAYIQSLRDHIADLEREAHRSDTQSQGGHSPWPTEPDTSTLAPETGSFRGLSPSPLLIGDQNADFILARETFELPIQTARVIPSRTTTPFPSPLHSPSLLYPPSQLHPPYRPSSALSAPALSSFLHQSVSQSQSPSQSPSQSHIQPQSHIQSHIHTHTQTHIPTQIHRQGIGIPPDTPSISPTSCPIPPSSLTLGPSPASLLSDDYSLPPRRVADWLLDIYFQNIHIFHPWVDRDSFMSAYTGLWSNQDPPPEHHRNQYHQENNHNHNHTQNHQYQEKEEEPDLGLGNAPLGLFHCALNAIFALACEFSNLNPDEKSRSSAIFAERMQSLVNANMDLLDGGSLGHVQALLLVGLYLQCTPAPHRAWHVVGMACRMAVGLGLHCPEPSEEISEAERRLRKGVWCACVQMDTILGVTMARPTPNHPLVPGSLPNSGFAGENLKLVGILRDIVQRIYRGGIEGFQTVMEIDRQLEGFDKCLPPGLQWDEHRKMSRQATILHSRYLYLKLLLYRPAFSRFSTRSPDEPTDPPGNWPEKQLEKCAMTCIETARSLIHTLHLAAADDKTSAWWYGIAHLIHAGIILVIVDAHLSSFSGVDLAELEDAWAQCLETLHRLVDVHPSARDYAIALSGLKHRYSGYNRELGGGVDAQLGYDHEYESLYDAWSPLVCGWGSNLEDISLPGQLLQEMDEELLLPNLF